MLDCIDRQWGVPGREADSRSLRSILGSFATGVVIVTTLDAKDQPVGVTANSFSSVSMDPPLVSWCLKTNSYSLPAFRHSKRFAINVLGSPHIDRCHRFAQGHAEKWRDVEFHAGKSGCPLFDDAIATIECNLYSEHEAGDHIILIGEIVQARAVENHRPLVFYRGGYYGLDNGFVHHGK